MGEMTELQALEYMLDAIAPAYEADLEPMGVIIAMIKERRRRKETMIERIARAAENAVFNPHAHGCSVSIVGDPARFYDAIARATLAAMREPTDAMIRAAGSGPADLSCWQRIIDVALEEG